MMGKLDDIKFKRCPPECPDRSIEPNCHMTCEGYLFRCEKIRKSKERKNENCDYADFKRHSVRKMQKIVGKIK